MCCDFFLYDGQTPAEEWDRRMYRYELLSDAQEEAGLKGCLCYEDLIEAERQHLAGFQWVRVDENDACGLCYTSGTTGKPKVRCAP